MKKVAILGDSISSGIGSMMKNYTVELQENLGDNFEIKNFAKTGTMIDYPLKIIDNIVNYAPDIVVLFYGNVDAQIRPNTKGPIFNILPQRYKNGGMLIPRPLYSKRRVKYVFDVIDNIIRKILRTAVTVIDGYEQWKNIETFENEYRNIIKNLVNLKAKFVFVSTLYVDSNYFKNSNSEYEKYNIVIEKIASEYDYPYVDLFTLSKNIVSKKNWDEFYLKDHFHPNEKGYSEIAKKISFAIKSLGR